MTPELTELEARIVGCLMEKEVTTPDQYPLSLNALTNACNQKSNRHPVMSLSQEEVQAGVDALMKKHYVTDRTGFGSRVAKYSQRFCNTHFGQLHFSGPEYAVICELLVRGPQTPGELRTHGSRLHPFREVSEVEEALADLAGRDEPLVVQLAREPGRRESRWAQRFTPVPEAAAAPASAPTPAPSTASRAAPGQGDLASRVAGLEATLAELTRRLESLEQRMEEASTAQTPSREEGEG